MTRSQIVLRVVVFLGPVVALLATGPAGHGPPWWAVAAVLVTAGAAAWQPDGPYLAVAGLAVLAWWAVSLGDEVPVSVLVAAVALFAAHLAAVLASYGPATMPVDAAVVRLWVRRGALVLLTVPAAWGLARLLDGEPEQPGIWLLGVAAAFVATVAATAALAVRSSERA
jgi:hypothetical protein